MNPLPKAIRRAVQIPAVGLAVLLGGAAHAEDVRQNVVSFQATATQEFNQDLMTVTLQATREGSQASDVQAALKLVLVERIELPIY